MFDMMNLKIYLDLLKNSNILLKIDFIFLYYYKMNPLLFKDTLSVIVKFLEFNDVNKLMRTCKFILYNVGKSNIWGNGDIKHKKLCEQLQNNKVVPNNIFIQEYYSNSYYEFILNKFVEKNDKYFKLIDFINATDEERLKYGDYIKYVNIESKHDLFGYYLYSCIYINEIRDICKNMDKNVLNLILIGPSSYNMGTIIIDVDNRNHRYKIASTIGYEFNSIENYFEPSDIVTFGSFTISEPVCRKLKRDPFNPKIDDYDIYAEKINDYYNSDITDGDSESESSDDSNSDSDLSNCVFTKSQISKLSCNGITFNELKQQYSGDINIDKGDFDWDYSLYTDNCSGNGYMIDTYFKMLSYRTGVDSIKLYDNIKHFLTSKLKSNLYISKPNNIYTITLNANSFALGNDMYLEICAYLDKNSLAKFMQVNKYFLHLIGNSNLWSHIDSNSNKYYNLCKSLYNNKFIQTPIRIRNYYDESYYKFMFEKFIKSKFTGYFNISNILNASYLDLFRFDDVLKEFYNDTDKIFKKSKILRDNLDEYKKIIGKMNIDIAKYIMVSYVDLDIRKIIFIIDNEHYFIDYNDIKIGGLFTTIAKKINIDYDDIKISGLFKIIAKRINIDYELFYNEISNLLTFTNSI